MIIRASCGHYIDDNCKCQTQDQRLAEKIEDLMQFCIWGPKDQKWFVSMLHELVAIARENP